MDFDINAVTGSILGIIGLLVLAVAGISKTGFKKKMPKALRLASKTATYALVAGLILVAIPGFGLYDGAPRPAAAEGEWEIADVRILCKYAQNGSELTSTQDATITAALIPHGEFANYAEAYDYLVEKGNLPPIDPNSQAAAQKTLDTSGYFIFKGVKVPTWDSMNTVTYDLFVWDATTTTSTSYTLGNIAGGDWAYVLQPVTIRGDRPSDDLAYAIITEGASVSVSPFGNCTYYRPDLGTAVLGYIDYYTNDTAATDTKLKWDIHCKADGEVFKDAHIFIELDEDHSDDNVFSLDHIKLTYPNGKVEEYKTLGTLVSSITTDDPRNKNAPAALSGGTRYWLCAIDQTAGEVDHVNPFDRVSSLHLNEIGVELQYDWDPSDVNADAENAVTFLYFYIVGWNEGEYTDIHHVGRTCGQVFNATMAEKLAAAGTDAWTTT